MLGFILVDTIAQVARSDPSRLLCRPYDKDLLHCGHNESASDIILITQALFLTAVSLFLLDSMLLSLSVHFRFLSAHDIKSKATRIFLHDTWNKTVIKMQCDLLASSQRFLWIYRHLMAIFTSTCHVFSKGSTPFPCCHISDNPNFRVATFLTTQNFRVATFLTTQISVLPHFW
jgi:hypothetical protein